MSLSLLAAAGANARTITDMAGRRVELPEHITRVYAAQPYTYVLMAALAPDLLVGIPSALSEAEQAFAPPALRDKPVLGFGMGPGARENLETLLRFAPQIALVKGGPDTDTRAVVEKYARIGLPVVFVDIDAIEHYAAGIEFTGALLGREARAAELAGYARRVLADVAAATAGIPEAERIGVYYAESPDGLATECDQSFHAAAIKLAGGRIVHHCSLSQHVGMEQLSLEQVIAYDPAVIVANEPAFAGRVADDPRWRGVRAVAIGRIYTVPRTPFNWIDRPPSIMRLIGVQWLAHRIYPERYPIDLHATVRNFQRLFFGVEPGTEALARLLD